MQWHAMHLSSSMIMWCLTSDGSQYHIKNKSTTKPTSNSIWGILDAEVWILHSFICWFMRRLTVFTPGTSDSNKCFPMKTPTKTQIKQQDMIRIISILLHFFSLDWYMVKCEFHARVWYLIFIRHAEKCISNLKANFIGVFKCWFDTQNSREKFKFSRCQLIVWKFQRELIDG